MTDLAVTIFMLVSIVTIPIIIIITGIKKVKVLRATYKKKFEEGLCFVEHKLGQSNFNISRRVGDYDEDIGCASYFLYVDDVNKKWVMTSPMDSKLDKIRNYEELLYVDFFDDDANDQITKAVNAGNAVMKVGMGALGAAAGAVAGGMLGSSSGKLSGTYVGGGLGAVGGAVGGAKLVDFLSFRSAEGTTSSYGLILRTTDSTVNKPVLIFDFLKIDGKVAVSNLPRLDRRYKSYRKDLETISAMFEVFQYILESAQISQGEQ
jgi:hypothetical protein